MPSLEGALVLEDNWEDYKLVGQSCWITVGNLAIWIRKDKEGGDGVTIEVLPNGSEAHDYPIEQIHVCFYEDEDDYEPPERELPEDQP